MSLMGRTLCLMHGVSAFLMAAAVVMGYAVSLGYMAASIHIPSGFLFALIIAFTHAMTMFYFVGMGVSMREAAGRRRWCTPYLDRAARFRRRLSLPLGLALVALMAAVILGGGSHTRWLPGWAHHTFSLVALALNLYASWNSMRFISANEALVREMEDALSSRSGHNSSSRRIEQAHGGR